MPEELYRIQDLCFQKDHSFLINHLDMYQYKGESLGLLGLHDSGTVSYTHLSCSQASSIRSRRLNPSSLYTKGFISSSKCL